MDGWNDSTVVSPQGVEVDFDEVLYESPQEADTEPFDDRQWVDGPPQRSLASAMELVHQSWTSETALAEFLTKGELHGDLQSSRLPRESKAAQEDRVARHVVQLRKDMDDMARELSRAGSATAQALFVVASIAVGCGCTTSAEWKAISLSMLQSGTLVPLFQALCCAGCQLLSAAKQDMQATSGDTPMLLSPSPRTSPLARAFRMACNGVAGVLLGSGIGLPFSPSAPPSARRSLALKALSAVAPYVYQGSVLSTLFAILREAPAAPALIPGKKLVLLVQQVIALQCGPVDLTPRCWQGTKKESSMGRWVGDGVVEQFIGSVLNSAANGCTRLSFLTADLLRSCHYHFLQAALKKGPSVSGVELAADPPPGFKEIPLPIREALAVLAVKLAVSLSNRRDADLTPIEKAGPTLPNLTPSHLAQLDKDPMLPSDDAFVLQDDRKQASLTPEYPPRYDIHLQPKGFVTVGTPSPAEWPSAHGFDYERRGQKEATDPREELYRTLLQPLTGIVLALLKLFLAALPAGADTGDQPRTPSLSELEAQSYGIQLPHEDGTAGYCELTRHRNIVMKAAGSLILYLVKLLGQHSPIQSAVLLQAIADSNGLLLLLKFLHQNTVQLLTGVEGVPEAGWDEAMEVPCPLPVHDGEHVPWGDMPGVDDVLVTLIPCSVILDGDSQGVVPVDTRCLFTCTVVLRLLQKLVHRQPSRLALMLIYKANVLIRRKLRLVHPLISLYGLKLLNDMYPHLGRRWRSQSTRYLSQLYRYIAPSIPDTYAAAFACADPSDAEIELPVPSELRDAEAHRHRVILEFNGVEYPSLRAGAVAADLPICRGGGIPPM